MGEMRWVCDSINNLPAIRALLKSGRKLRKDRIEESFLGHTVGVCRVCWHLGAVRV